MARWTKARLRVLGSNGLVIAAGLALIGLAVVWPAIAALHAKGATRVQLALTPLAACSIGLGAAGYWWLRRPLRGGPTGGTFEVGSRERTLRAYQDRASKLRVAAALVAYYLPGLVVTIVQHRAGGVEGYLRSHLMDGFGFVGFLTVGWQLVSRDIHKAAELLTQSSVVIAMAGAFSAGGSLLAVGLSAVAGQLFFGQLWQWVASTGLDAQPAQPGAWPGRNQVIVTERATDTLRAGERLTDLQCLRSASGEFRLLLCVGELTIWGPDDAGPAWVSRTLGSGAQHAELDADGRLGLYGDGGALVAWQSPVPGGGADQVRLLDNGVLAAFRPDGTTVWAIIGQPPASGYQGFSFFFHPEHLPAGQ